MFKKVVAMSCMELVQYVFYNRSNVDKFAIISIQEIENNGNGFVFTETGCCKKVLTLQFSDVNPKTFEDLGETECLEKLISEGKCLIFSDKEAYQIKEFLEEIVQDKEIKTLIVHCSAGVSRSPAVAAAITKKYLGDDSFFFETQIPNKHVYNLLLEILDK